MIQRIILVVLGAMALPGLAGASPIYSENFDAPGFLGGALIVAPGERAMATTYGLLNNYDGWQFIGGAYAAVVGGNTAIELYNWPSGATAATNVAGLVPNARYELSFTLTGDNMPNSLSDLLVAIDGTQRLDITHSWSTIGAGTLVTTDFTATSSLTRLLFTEHDAGGGTPAIDNVQISRVSEPASVAMLGAALLGLGLARRQGKPRALPSTRQGRSP